MTKLRKLTLLVIIGLSLLATGAFAQAKLVGYTTWDDAYFYAAFQVDDTDIQAKNTTPFSKPTEDDCIEIFLETDAKHSPGRSSNSYHMAVSPAGGSTFTQGNDAGKWSEKKIMSFKYSATYEGSLNNSEDADQNYSIEIAIPWVELGMTAPKPSTKMSFNAIVRMRGEMNTFVSLSPLVKTEEDIHDASKWSNIFLTTATFGAATLSPDQIISTRYIAHLPLIDGQLRSKEWNTNTSFTLELPQADSGLMAKHAFPRTTLAYYNYSYQADTRKSAPVSRLEMTDTPVRTLGPWISYDRVQWHKDELNDIKRAGIDVILPVYSGDPSGKAGYAAKGLDCMVEALRELKTEKKPYPMVGMFFDTNAMQAAYGAKPDMQSEEVRQTFYGMIHDFFSRIPEEFLMQVQTADDRASRPSYVVQLLTSANLSNVDPSLMTYINNRFTKDFGANLIWIGASDFKDKAPCDGYCDNAAGLAFGYDDTAMIRIAAIGPGYDDTGLPGSKTPIQSRDGGNTYQKNWTKALAKRPTWVVIDSWNDLRSGSEICGTRQYGFGYVDTTALQSLKFKGGKAYSSKMLRTTLPKTIMPGRFYQVSIKIQNDGMKPWKVAEGYALAYRWYQNGMLVAESGIKRPIQEDVLPGHAADLTIGVAAVKEKGEALPEGDYELRLDMIRMADGKWFSSLGGETYGAPITIGKPAESQARFVSVDGPVMMRTGTDYHFKVSVRNDGTAVWPAKTAAIGCRLFRVSNYLHGGSKDLKEELLTPIQAVLATDVQPGDVAAMDIVVNLKDADGKPIPAWKQSDNWSYQLKFDVWDGKNWLSETGSRAYDRVVDVFESDFSARITASDVSDTLDAKQSYDVKLVVTNTGTEPWTAANTSFGYHWYYLDGTEAVWDGVKTSIKGQIKPGEPAMVTAKLKTPEYDGRYILVWDMAVKDKWASTSDICRGGDLLVSEVTVQNGKLTYIDLTSTFDVVASTIDSDTKNGDFDGQGRTFPAELMVPDVSAGKLNDLYPCGYNCKLPETGMDAPKHISFKYGPKNPGDKNAVKCAGQTLTVTKAKYSKVHILAAAVEPDQGAEFGVGYGGAPQIAKLTMSSWTEAPAHGEELAFSTLHRHSTSGDERGYQGHLFHYIIEADPSKPIDTIVLPKNDKIRIVAITLEK